MKVNPNNNLSFGSIMMNVRFNNEPKIIQCFKDCDKLKDELTKEKDKIILKAQGYMHPRKNNNGEYDFFVRCINKNGTTNFNEESLLKKRFENWAKNIGYLATINESLLMNIL